MKWSCALQPCDQPALRTLQGQCEVCYQHLCKKHVVSALHTCPTTEDINAVYVTGDPAKLKDLNSVRRMAGEKMITGLLESIDYDALCVRAEGLRDGVKCTVNFPPANEAYCNCDVVGGRNYHGSIVFDDGKTWMARFKLPNHTEPPLQERNFDRRSEFATYRFLATADVPAPEVYDCADDDDPTNLVGAGYILLEKIAGKPLVWHEASEVQKEKLCSQLAEIYTSLEQHSFSKLGRPQLSSSGRPEAGPAFFEYSSKGDLITFGPFSNSNDYYTALFHQQIQLIKTGEIAASAPLDQYLVYMSLLESLPPNESGPFFLRHVDSRDANFLVDDEYNITSIIDWELALVTAKSSAFQSPLLLYDLDELYHKGLSTPSEDEKRLSKFLREERGSIELFEMAEQKLHFRVEQVIEADPGDRINFERVFSGWWKISQRVEVFDWDSWYKQALEKYGDGGFIQ